MLNARPNPSYRVSRSSELYLIERGDDGRLVSDRTIGGVAPVRHLLKAVQPALTEPWSVIERADHDALPEIVRKAIAIDE